MTASETTDKALNNLTATRVPPQFQDEPEPEKVNHPAHYGGKDDPFEVLKIIEHYDLGFATGNALKYLLRAGRKPGEPYADDLKKAAFYLNREIERVES